MNLRTTLTPDAIAALDRAGLSRRGFLKSSGALIVGFSLTSAAGGMTVAPVVIEAQTPPDPRTRLDSWIAIAASGRVTAYAGKCELGQGLYTAQTQLVAEELGVPLSQVTLVQCDTALTPDQGTTSGAQSHPTNFRDGNLALAAVTAREVLLGLASRVLGLPVEQLMASDGQVRATADPSRSVSYGDLIGGRKFEVTLNANGKRKPARDWKVLGTPVPRLDIPDLVTARVEYVHNVRVPGMLHGRVVRPPGVGATLVRVDEGSVSAMPGFVRVVVRQNFVGVVAEKPWQAQQIAARLSATWVPGASLPPQASYYDYMRKQPGYATTWVDSGDVDATLARAHTVLRSTYYHPYQMHASLGSSCAVADVRDGKATVWAATQNAHGLKSTTAMLLGMRPEDVHVIFTRGSGCYGINGVDTVSFDAALMSHAAGRPVRVQLTRQDEMAWENYGVASVIDQQVGLDASGAIVAWDYSGWYTGRGGRVGTGLPGNVVTGFLTGFQPVAFEPRPPAPATAPFNDRNNAPAYVKGCVGGACYGNGTVASERAIARRVESPFFTGPLRSPEHLQNTFAHESFMDEVAAKVKADPVEYRLRHLSDPRLIAVIKEAARAAGWNTRPSPQTVAPGTGTVRGRGFASMAMESGVHTNGWIAMAVEVEVHRESGTVAVKRIVLAHDCGQISNPDGLRNQLEGATLQGMSRALGEEVTWDGEKITSIDWRTYRMPSLGAEMPAIEMVLIDRPDAQATGAGETGSSVIAAAIGNAIFDATGARLREVPFTPERVKQALAG